MEITLGNVQEVTRSANNTLGHGLWYTNADVPLKYRARYKITGAQITGQIFKFNE